MPDVAQLSDAKQALLKKYLRGDMSNAPFRPSGITRRASGERVPLTFAQEQLWFLSQLAPGVPVYNEPITLYMSDSVDVPALQQSFTDIFDRHEAWRTTFPVVDGQPVQVIHPPRTFKLSVTDLRDLPEAARDAEFYRITTEEACRPFDLATDTLVRVRLVRLGDDEYRLLIILHHIIMDGITIYGVLLPELALLYNAHSQGTPLALPELPVQYGDYAVWQRRNLKQDVVSVQLEYWRKQLDGIPVEMQLPIDHTRPRIQSFRGAQQRFALGKELTQDLKALSRQEGVTLFMLLLAGFKALLYRYSGQTDIVVGTATAGRKRTEVERLLGYFLNPVVLRTNFSGDPSFRDLLHRVREVTLGAYAHDDVPFGHLVRELHPERDLSRNTFIQVMCNMEPPLPELPPGWRVSQMDVDTGTAKRDLYLELDDRSEGIIGRLQYNTDLFEPSTISLMLQQWQTLLKGAVADPAQHVADISLWTEDERQALIPSPHLILDRPLHRPVTDEIVGWAMRQPDAPAVKQGDSSWNYSTLVRTSVSIAQVLVARGVTRGDVVAVSGQRSPGFIACVVGILMSDAVLLTLDCHLPHARQQTMLALVRAKHLLLVGERRADNPWLQEVGDLDIIEVNPESGRLVALRFPAISQDSCLPVVDADDPAYVFFTSGTTGVPKPVLGCHAGLSHFLAWERETCRVGPGDRVAQLTGLSFDVVLRDIFLPLISGATLCLPDNNLDLSASWIMTWLERESISILHTVPTLVHLWLDGDRSSVSLSALRWILFAGEPLPAELVQRWRSAYPQAGEIGNLYGPTETTLAKCFYHLPGDLLPGIQPVGQPLPQTQALVLSPSGHLCGPREMGEIVIRTPFRSLGYLNSPEESRKRFVKNPYRDDEEDLFYFTGDRGRFRSDGVLEILGRLDDQVKIRGMRIEPREVETVCDRYPGVHRTVVLAQVTDSGDQRLLGYVVPQQGQSIDVVELRRYLRERLPAYMIPGTLVLREGLPLSPNGKVDRQALLRDFSHIRGDAMEGQTSAQNAATPKYKLVPPTLTVHHQLVRIWEDILDVRPIGITDDFFDLGGHSLLAVRLLTEIERTCGKKIPLTTLFTGATIDHLANVMLQQDSAASGSPLVRVQAGASKPPLFFLHGDVEGGGFYCVKLARSLGVDQPFYMLQPHGGNGLENSRVPQSIEAMARDLLPVVRSVQAEGPYLLGGFCNGGVVAFEMARQLQADGQAVDALIVIDSSPVDAWRVKFLRELINYVGAVLGLDWDEQLSYFLRVRRYGRCTRSLAHWAINPFMRTSFHRVWEKVLLGVASFDAVPSKPVNAPSPRTVTVPNSRTREQDIVGTYRWIKSRYNPNRYLGRVTLIESQESHLANYQDPTLGWIRVADEVDVRVVPGAHLTCITDHIAEIVDSIRARLDEVIVQPSSA